MNCKTKKVLGQTLYIETSEDCSQLIDTTVSSFYRMLSLDENGKGQIKLGKIVFDFLDEFKLSSDDVSYTMHSGLLKYILIQMLYEAFVSEKVKYLISFSGSVVNGLSDDISIAMLGVQTKLKSGEFFVSNVLTPFVKSNLNGKICDSSIAIGPSDKILKVAIASILVATNEYLNAMSYTKEDITTMFLSKEDRCFYTDNSMIVESNKDCTNVFDVITQEWN